jgi:hypothetical protein
MTRRDGLSGRELDELIERGRIVRPLPDVVRARALARARATAATEATALPAVAPTPAVSYAPRRRGTRVALAASIALVLCAAGAVAALGVRIRDRVESSPPATSDLEAPRPAAPSTAAAEPKPVGKLPHSSRPAPAQESYAAELDLLQRAQVAYAEHDLSAALVLVAAHARHFPHGRLAEEREALRVRSLARSGRTDEARRAAGSFANRFPRSVLLPRLREIAGTPN